MRRRWPANAEERERSDRIDSLDAQKPEKRWPQQRFALKQGELQQEVVHTIDDDSGVWPSGDPPSPELRVDAAHKGLCIDEARIEVERRDVVAEIGWALVEALRE